MKMRLMIYSFIGALVFGVLAGIATAASTDFSGTWVLDTENMPPIPPPMEGYTMIVTQDQSQITVENKMVGDFNKPIAEPEGPPPGEPPHKHGFRGGPGFGGEMGMRGLGLPKATSLLDGSETTVEAEGPIPGTTTLKAEWAEGGKVLERTIIRTLNFPDRTITSTTKERWELSEDGQRLEVVRTVESPRTVHTTQLTFKRAGM